MGSRGKRRPHRERWCLIPHPCQRNWVYQLEDWHQTPVSVRLVVLTLLTRLDTLEARLNQNSSNSSRPPSTDAPATKRQRRMPAAERRKPGGKHGHPGHPQVLLEPTVNRSALSRGMCLWPSGIYGTDPVSHPSGALSCRSFVPTSRTGCCTKGSACHAARSVKRPMPADQGSGYGPRLTGFVGEIAGIVGANRSAVQDLCISVFGIPLIRKGAIQKMVDRVSASDHAPTTRPLERWLAYPWSIISMRPRGSPVGTGTGCG